MFPLDRALLRPTKSATAFLLQFGRTLRRAPDKPVLTAFAFVGHQRKDSQSTRAARHHRGDEDRPATPVRNCALSSSGRRLAVVQGLADILVWPFRRRRATCSSEPLFHRTEQGTTKTDFEALTTQDFWEVGASGQCHSRDFTLFLLEKRYAEPGNDWWETCEFVCRQLSVDCYVLTYLLPRGEWLTRRATSGRRPPGAGRSSTTKARSFLTPHEGTLARSCPGPRAVWPRKPRSHRTGSGPRLQRDAARGRLLGPHQPSEGARTTHSSAIGHAGRVFNSQHRGSGHRRAGTVSRTRSASGTVDPGPAHRCHRRDQPPNRSVGRPNSRTDAASS